MRARRQSLSRSSWLLLVGGVYLCAISIEFNLTGTVLDYIDQNYPGVYFYHLQEGEGPGPLPDANEAWIADCFGYGLLSLLFVPFAVFVRVPFLAIAGLILLKDPAEMLSFEAERALVQLLGF